MHGLVIRSLQCFLREIYGEGLWSGIAGRAGLVGGVVEPLGLYDSGLVGRILAEASRELDKPESEILEDMGGFLVSHPSCEPVRRLLRFGGDGFLDFLYSLSDLKARAALAVRDLDLPEIVLREHHLGALTVTVSGGPKGFADLLVGLLRSMADDYGALVMLERLGRDRGTDIIDIQLLDLTHAEGRRFQISKGA